jgi:two-component system chemotaxis response regulator CheY
MRILVVDDSKVARAVLRKILKEIGHEEVIEAADGVEALDKVQSQSFDLVITDWNMPNLDGLGLVRELQDLAVDVPVLMVSSESYFNRIVDVMRAGAEGYIRKPFTAEALNQKIVEVHKKRELSAQAATAATLAGRLEEIGFPELIQFLTGCRRNGRVVIEVNGKAGTVDLREGEARAAAWDGLEGDAAIYAITEHDSGTFRFQPSQGVVEPNITQPTMTLLIEALRKRDEKASAV